MHANCHLPQFENGRDYKLARTVVGHVSTPAYITEGHPALLHRLWRRQQILHARPPSEGDDVEVLLKQNRTHTFSLFASLVQRRLDGKRLVITDKAQIHPLKLAGLFNLHCPLGTA